MFLTYQAVPMNDTFNVYVLTTYTGCCIDGSKSKHVCKYKQKLNMLLSQSHNTEINKFNPDVIHKPVGI